MQEKLSFKTENKNTQIQQQKFKMTDYVLHLSHVMSRKVSQSHYCFGSHRLMPKITKL